MNLTKLFETVKVNNPNEPDTYQRKATAIINSQFHDYDIVNFCNQKNILVTDLRLGSRLWQFPLETLEQVWKSGVSTPEELYKEAVQFSKSTVSSNEYLEKYGFDSDEVTDFKNSISDEMIETLEKNKKLVKANIEYLQELGVQNIKELFLAYYEMFLMDHSNFEAIFNQYDREDLVEKLAKNIEIMEYL